MVLPVLARLNPHQNQHPRHDTTLRVVSTHDLQPNSNLFCWRMGVSLHLLYFDNPVSSLDLFRAVPKFNHTPLPQSNFEHLNQHALGILIFLLWYFGRVLACHLNSMVVIPPNTHTWHNQYHKYHSPYPLPFDWASLVTDMLDYHRNSSIYPQHYLY